MKPKIKFLAKAQDYFGMARSTLPASVEWRGYFAPLRRVLHSNWWLMLRKPVRCCPGCEKTVPRASNYCAYCGYALHRAGTTAPGK